MFERDPFAVSRPATQGGWYIIPLRAREGYLEENILYLADVAGRLWELLEAPQTRESLIDQLLSEYDVERTVLAADVGSCLARLVELRAVFTGGVAG